MDLTVLESMIASVGTTLAVLIPAVVAVYYQLSKKWKASVKEIKSKDKEKSLDILKNFTYNESLKTTSTLKSIVNMYRDKSSADVVCYYSLEDGTVAESKLHNLYITMIAESDRFSEIPRYLSHVQRVPIPQVLDIVTKVQDSRDGVDSFKEIFKETPIDEKIHVVHSKVNSAKVRPVSNSEGYTIGFVAFLYKDLTYEDYVYLVESGDLSKDDILNVPITNDPKLINECRAVIEAEFIKYTESVKSKRIELGLDTMNINYEKKR